MVEQDGKIIATASVVLEPKFKGHEKYGASIEDVVVLPEYQGRGIGKLIVDYVVNYIKDLCYRVILDCDETNVEFYQKCNFKRR